MTHARHMMTAVLMVGAIAFSQTTALAETPQELLKRLESKMKSQGDTSMSSTTKMTMKSPYMQMEQVTKSWAVQSGDTYKSRSETEGSQTMAGNTTKTKTISVSDGKYAWTETHANGVVQVTKMDAPKASAFDHGAITDQLQNGNWTVKPSEDVEGQKCAVLESTQGAGPAAMTMTYWFSEATGMMVKMVTKGEAIGETTMLVTDVKMGASIPGDKFQYSPPAGAQITDTTGAG